MRLILAGCEYSGTTTLAYAIKRWAEGVFGDSFPLHDHFKIPHLNHAEDSDRLFADWAAGRGEDPTRLGLTSKEQERFLALTPRIKEMFQRYHLEYHVSASFYSYRDHTIVGGHIDEAVYAPLYYGYGRAGEYGDRVAKAPLIEETIMAQAPDTVLVLVKASPDAIRSRMREDPHENAVLQAKDVEHVLARFEEEYERSSIVNKLAIDTTTTTVDECLQEFVTAVEPLLTDADLTRILVHKARQKPDWV